MRWLLIFGMFFILSGCMKASEMMDEANYYLSDAGLLDQQRLERSANRRIQQDSTIFIAQSHFPPVGYEAVSDTALAQATFNAFVPYFPHMRRSLEPLGLEQAMLRARKEGTDYLLYTRFAEADKRMLATRSTIQFMLYDIGTGRLVDHGSIQMRGGLLVSYENKPEAFLRKPMQEYAQKLLGLREY